jgi:hypothetical protein
MYVCARARARLGLREFNKHSINITSPELLTTELHRQNDTSSMKIIYDSSLSLKPWQIRAVNRCRILLQVITLSGILKSAYNGMNATLRTTLMWPSQPIQKTTDWVWWRKALMSISHQGPMPNFHSHLGQWTFNPPRIRPARGDYFNKLLMDGRATYQSAVTGAGR